MASNPVATAAQAPARREFPTRKKRCIGVLLADRADQLWTRSPGGDHHEQIVDVHLAIALRRTDGRDITGAARRTWRWACPPCGNDRQQIVHVHGAVEDNVGRAVPGLA